ncbi:MAG: 4Fe-4S ferredoxin [Dethiobacter sp.]|nr:MAG: 4Fe-4S ferredoxin [Dethiobacter sp.]
MKRKIVYIDENKCNGCGLCVPACHEGAIQIIDGKARLVAENLCDGLGDCLGECPEGAIIILEREADPYDEETVKKHLSELEGDILSHNNNCKENLPCGCPSTQLKTIVRDPKKEGAEEEHKMAPCPSLLRQWPVQLALLPPRAKFFQGASLLVAADCVPFAYGNFHRDFLEDKAVVVGCPKLDDAKMYLEKLAEIIQYNDIKKITVVYMQVPCCSGLRRIVELALYQAGKDIAVESVVISAEGEILENIILMAPNTR